MSRCLLIVLPVAALAGALFGCPGTLDDPDRFRPPGVDGGMDPDGGGPADTGTSTVTDLVTTTEIKAAILEPKCAFAGCHGATMTQGMLDLSGDASSIEARIIDARSPTAICNGRTLVVAGNPDRSLMFVKLSMTATLCGTRMPQGPELSVAEKDMMRQWIIDLGVP